MNIIFNDNGLTRNLSSEMQKKLPRALAGTLNKIAFEATKGLKAAEQSELHLTRPFIQSSTQYEAARSAQGLNMQSVVGVLDRVKFIERLVDGGKRTPTASRYIAVPVAARRGTAGGILKSQRPSEILNKPGYFLRTFDGVPGIWYSKKGNIKLMYVLKSETDYDHAPYLDFEQVVIDSAATHKFDEMIAQSILRSLGLTP